jgi:hypothetical protein
VVRDTYIERLACTLATRLRSARTRGVDTDIDVNDQRGFREGTRFADTRRHSVTVFRNQPVFLISSEPFVRSPTLLRDFSTPSDTLACLARVHEQKGWRRHLLCQAI